jgi:chemotaxis protein histidine kinase CheA
MECWILVVKNKIRAFILGALILSFLNEINASDLEEYKSQAKNASVIVYGKSQDGETYVLLAHDRRGFWTPPGGKREANQSILDTAAAELYEETAAFDLFNPSRIKPLLKKQPLKSVFKYNGHTDLFALNIGDQIDQCKNISHNYKERVKGKKHSFDEMNNWKLCKANDLFNSLKAHPHTVNQDTILNKIGKLPKYVFNSLWSFYNNGSLENLMKTSTILLSQKQQKQKEQEIDAFLSSPERQAILRKNQKELFKHQPEDFFGKQPKKQQTQIKAPVAQKAKTSAQKKADDAARQLAAQKKKADDAVRQLAAQKKKANDEVRQKQAQLAQLATQKKKAQAVAAQRAAAQKARTMILPAAELRGILKQPQLALVKNFIG